MHNCSFAHFVLRKTAFSSVHSINYWIYLYWWNLFHLLPRKNLRQNLNWQITYCLFLVMRSENIFARIMTKLWRPKPFYESVILWCWAEVAATHCFPMVFSYNSSYKLKTPRQLRNVFSLKMLLNDRRKLFFTSFSLWPWILWEESTQGNVFELSKDFTFIRYLKRS